MRRTITRRDGAAGPWQRRAALWSVLASSYALAHLLVSRTIAGVWELDAKLLLGLLVVTLVQLAVLELLPARCSRAAASPHAGDSNRQEAPP